MQRLLMYIGIGLFALWTLAIFVNASIYQETTLQPILFGPMSDAILFMAVMVTAFLLLANVFRKSEKTANSSLLIIGLISIVGIFIV
ncbi:hypothetical protein [Texcoconibacillus texcoconensis]|uniref:Glucan phosphoethanolaminetransferase (Alkaline phosphatase superfamily) n=1 Tax=Texcoconibacillus texcoconensis TaxID=1095777 RepID=A0A840QSW8_9BACI|nr:hypothetical protein [Texcoconibacillus texcoconensis]MBB5174367.1 glucan phosphoethanolaminetransferase (alkaline phosphatase superfamily) [Texcoconibacillus texcoconensis]